MATRELTTQEKLAAFVERWHDYHSTEMAGSQSYLRHLLECYDAEDYEPGEIFEQHPVMIPDESEQTALFLEGAKPTETKYTSKRMDMYIPRVCVWEMKGPKEKLEKHYDQVFKYWKRSRPRYMVLCNFHEIWIYDTDETPETGDRDGLTQPYRIALADLPEKYEALNFLRGAETHFAKRSEEVTRLAARYIGQAVRELIETSDNRERDRERITKFALECVFAMFGEDTGIIPGKLFEQAMKTAQGTGDLAPVYSLFDDFGREEDYERSHNMAPYINGPLFDRKHPKFAVDRSILGIIYMAAQYDWTAVRPEVFGSIFEQAIDPAHRHELGAHFTAESDIMKVVGPTVVRPWRERIKACKTHKDCEKLIERMKNYHVLDPACGSGNFLYVVYREMKLLEQALARKWEERHNYNKKRADKRSAPKLPYFTIEQLHGIDIDEIAVQLTRVVLWIGQHLAGRESETGEAALPLKDLSANIIKADALFTDWFRPADDGVSELAIVGNPPFMGRHKMRLEMGDEYVDRLHKAYPNNRNADFVTYWYTQALKFLREGERAGFVSTNMIGKGENRKASLDCILESNGTITSAWNSYPWPGEAAVYVSIVAWIQSPFEGLCYLDGCRIDRISAVLKHQTDVLKSQSIARNHKICFEGVKPGNNQFVFDENTRALIIAEDKTSSAVIKPLIIARDLVRNIEQQPSRFVVDYCGLSLSEAKKYDGAFRYIQENVFPARTSEFQRKTKREIKEWWLFERCRPEMRESIASMSDYIVVARVAPHLVFALVSSEILADSRLKVIALDHYYSFGILQSAIHEIWSWSQGSTLETRISYTNTTIFETFPFPLADCRDPFASSSTSAPACADDEDASTGARATDDGSGGVPAADEGNSTEAGTTSVPGRRPLKMSTGRDACSTEDSEIPDKADLLKLYDPRTVPDTPEAKHLSAVAGELYEKRQAACKSLNLGLTKLYNYIKGKSPLTNLTTDHQQRITELQELHEQLNNATCACYGWPEDTWRDENEVLTRLLKLNLALTA